MNSLIQKLHLALLHMVDKVTYGAAKAGIHQYTAEKAVFVRINMLLQKEQRIHKLMFQAYRTPA